MRVTRAVPFTGWLSTLDPVLLPDSGGGVQAIVAGQHSGDGNDTLNGTQLVPRHSDGSFGAPTTIDSTLGYGATSAVLAADGSTPLWASGGPFGDQLLVFSGASEQDLTAASPGFTSSPTIGRDSSGRVWLAWSAPPTGSGPNGLYMMQLDPQTGAPLGPAIHAPNSENSGAGIQPGRDGVRAGLPTAVRRHGPSPRRDPLVGAQGDRRDAGALGPDQRTTSRPWGSSSVGTPRTAACGSAGRARAPASSTPSSATPAASAGRSCKPPMLSGVSAPQSAVAVTMASAARARQQLDHGRQRLLIWATVVNEP